MMFFVERGWWVRWMVICGVERVCDWIVEVYYWLFMVIGYFSLLSCSWRSNGRWFVLWLVWVVFGNCLVIVLVEGFLIGENEGGN